MGLNILKWLIPIIMELFKSNGKYQNYFKRNKTISLLIIACLVCIAFGLFFFEQAVVHGTNSKQRNNDRAALVDKLEACEQTNKSKIVCE